VSLAILSVALRHERDVVAARRRARDIAALLGFDVQDQTRIATAVSEIARNAVGYGGGGKAEFLVEGQTSPQLLVVRVSDRGPGIADVAGILRGEYRSPNGMGLGIVGARRLMDRFEIDSAPGRGTTVLLKQMLPSRVPVVDRAAVARFADVLARQATHDPLAEVQQQNRELLAALDELGRRQEDLVRLNHELEDTNRGVVALYAELDEKADHLRRADELKSRFLSNMSHEFRTPVNSITALARLLLDRADGPLTPEQAKQVHFIMRAAEDLADLVNDLLDLAKVEAGKTVVRPAEFEVENLFGALRGMLRPLLVGEAVSLVFEDAAELPPLRTDEGKVSQILRNFISNALKFTERGEVRVSAALTPDQQAVAFSVADTGIGIAPQDQERIFEEFGQVDNPVQRRVKGTGLGLPLSRRLADLLGGRITLTSAVGVGSTFTLVVPLVYTPSTALALAAAAEASVPDPGRLPVLVVEDSAEALMLYEKYLRGSRFQVFPVRSVRDAERALARIRPRAVILDILLPGEDAWRFLARLKTAEDSREIPVIVATAVEDERKGRALGADAFATKPVQRQWLLDALTRLTEPRARRVLVIDDEEISRYLLRQSLRDSGHVVLEAASGREGLRRAREDQPHVIFLDLVMPEMSGAEVLDELQADPGTRGIPVVIVTSKVLSAAERMRLGKGTVEILSKASPSRDEALASVRDALTRAGLE
jgi:signal transduction histidine kinase/DNA-binding response OmpR family regulator